MIKLTPKYQSKIKKMKKVETGEIEKLSDQIKVNTSIEYPLGILPNSIYHQKIGGTVKIQSTNQ